MAALGLYAPLAYLMVPGFLIVNALGESALPSLARSYGQNNIRAFRHLMVKLLLIVLSLGLLAVALAALASQGILTVFYGAEYARGSSIFIWLMTATALGCLAFLFDYGLTATKYFKTQMATNGLTVGVVLAASFLAVPEYGEAGAAVALCVAVLAQLVFKGTAVYFIS